MYFFLPIEMLINMPVPSVLGKRACLLSFKYLKAKIGNKHLWNATDFVLSQRMCSGF